MKRIKKFFKEHKEDIVFGIVQGYFSVVLCIGVLGSFVEGLAKAGVVIG